MIRIGQGYDVHPFVEGRRLVLGGVTIDHPRGLKGPRHRRRRASPSHPCGGLLSCPDHFPDTDGQYKGIDSRELLRGVRERIHDHGWRVVNVDSTVVAQAPRLAPYLPAMRENIATDLTVDVNGVNIKATNPEKLGFLGREEGIAAYAVVLLESVS